MGLQNQMVEREELLHKRQKEIETLKDQFDTLSDDDPQHVRYVLDESLKYLKRIKCCAH